MYMHAWMHHIYYIDERIGYILYIHALTMYSSDDTSEIRGASVAIVGTCQLIMVRMIAHL